MKKIQKGISLNKYGSFRGKECCVHDMQRSGSARKSPLFSRNFFIFIDSPPYKHLIRKISAAKSKKLGGFKYFNQI